MAAYLFANVKVANVFIDYADRPLLSAKVAPGPVSADGTAKT